MPFGPSVDLTRSAIAIAPMNDAMRAPSPFCSSACSLSTICASAGEKTPRART